MRLVVILRLNVNNIVISVLIFENIQELTLAEAAAVPIIVGTSPFRYRGPG